jgi:methenyltetrahydrofolate cyclohydrolase
LNAGEPFLEQRLAAFLDAVAEKTSTPGGGGVAAVTIALAAALAGMTARFSEKKLGEEAERLSARADELRTEVAALAQEDADAYGAYVEARRRPDDDPGRAEALEKAEARAAEVPLRIAELGAAVSELAEELAERGNPNLAGDAYTSAVVAQAGTRAAANLVLINLGGDDADERVRRARELAQQAGAAAAHAVEADAGPDPKP